jgi:hypothetical protein
MFCRKKNRVGCEVILQRMQEEADRRRRQGGDPVRKDAWAPVLADSGTGLHDIRVECEENDPQRVWRLETLLAAARAAVSEQERWNETLHDSLTKKGVTIGEQDREIERQDVAIGDRDREIERLLGEIERLRDESGVAKENERLRVELLLADEAKDLATKAAANVAKLVEGLEVALQCPLSLGQVEDPVGSIYGHSYSRGHIENWLTSCSRCPISNQCLTKNNLVKNFALANVADALNAYQAQTGSVVVAAVV